MIIRDLKAEYKDLEEAFDIIANQLCAAETKIRQQHAMIELLKKALLRRCDPPVSRARLKVKP